MEYIIKKGNNKHVIFALHGSRSKLETIMGKAKKTDQEATIVGVQGTVKERGATRYFLRHESDETNAKSMKDSTLEFDTIIREIIKKNKFENHAITLLGYSNGANLIENLLKVYADVEVDNVVLFHPASITPEQDFKKQKGLKVLLTTGKEDNFLPEEKFEELEKRLFHADIDLKVFVHEGGHEMIDKELVLAKELFLQ